MCNFCEALVNNDKEIAWQVRSTYSDDNINEYLDGIEIKSVFKMNSYLHKEQILVGVEYRQEIQSKENEEIIISPFSEMIQFNFCPICGIQISKNIEDFENYYSHQIDVRDRIK